MFRRVNLEAWHNVVPYICFALIAGVFIAIVVRAIRMKQSDVDRIASLPLRDDNEAASIEPTNSQNSHE